VRASDGQYSTKSINAIEFIVSIDIDAKRVQSCSSHDLLLRFHCKVNGLNGTSH